MSKKGEIESFVSGQINKIEKTKNEQYRTATLAQLRRGIGKTPGELPQLWGMLFRDMPQELMGRGKEPSREEWAAYTALTLYAYHQQGINPTTDSMNKKGQGIGTAAAMLVEKEDDEKRIQNRFNRFALAEEMPQMATHLRGLVSMLRAKQIGMDYPLLASQLYLYQFYDHVSEIRLKWGRDFYKTLDQGNKEEETEE